MAFTALCMLFCSLWAFAHEFWLAPGAYRVNPGQQVPLLIMVGENYKGEPWHATKQRITSIQHLTTSGSQELWDAYPLNDTAPLMVSCASAGLHFFTLATNNKYIELAPAKFEAYLTEDGLDRPRAYRKQHAQQLKPGREVYRRCAKTLLQCAGGQDSVFCLPAGLTLEIIPLQNPYALHPGKALTLQVRYEGKPLEGALVQHWLPGKRAVAAQRTDAKGNVNFRLLAGPQLISTVWMTPHLDTLIADWQSTWASLTFDVQ